MTDNQPTHATMTFRAAAAVVYLACAMVLVHLRLDTAAAQVPERPVHQQQQQQQGEPEQVRRYLRKSCNSAVSPTPVTVPDGQRAAAKRKSQMVKIPQCGPGFTGCQSDPDDPFLDVEAYCNAVRAQSAGKCPRPIVHLTENIAEVRYWLPPAQQGGEKKRLSTGFQYYSLEHSRFKYDEVFVYDYAFDSTHVGGEIYETTFGTTEFLVSIPKATNGEWECHYLTQAMGWSLLSSADLENPEIATYCGVDVVPEPGFFMEGEVFDIYVVRGRWFAGTPVVWFVNRKTGRVAGQVYYQSSSFAQSQNYFWDMSRALYDAEQSAAKFAENADYYLDLNAEMVAEACPGPANAAVRKAVEDSRIAP